MQYFGKRMQRCCCLKGVEGDLSFDCSITTETTVPDFSFRFTLPGFLFVWKRYYTTFFRKWLTRGNIWNCACVDEDWGGRVRAVAAIFLDSYWSHSLLNWRECWVNLKYRQYTCGRVMFSKRRPFSPFWGLTGQTVIQETFTESVGKI